MSDDRRPYRLTGLVGLNKETRLVTTPLQLEVPGEFSCEPYPGAAERPLENDEEPPRLPRGLRGLPACRADDLTDVSSPSSTVEHVRWHPSVTVEKYSPDQTAWAKHKLRRELARGYRPTLNHVRLGDHRGTLRNHGDRLGYVTELHGDWLRELFPGGPEDGYAHADGNVLTNVGLTVLIKLMTGAGGTSYYPLAPTSGATVSAVVGTGTNNGGTGPRATSPCTDTHLTDDGTSNAYYQGMDNAYPTLTTPATINGQSTFASGVANYQWNEWCWATGPTGTVVAGNALASIWSTSAATFMLNHKTNLYSGGGATLGTKGAGASWVFTTTLVFS